MLNWTNTRINTHYNQSVIAAAIDPGQKVTGFAWIER